MVGQLRRLVPIQTLSLLALLVAWPVSTAAAATTPPRTVVVFPFDASALPLDDRWMGEAIAQVLDLGLARLPAIARVDRGRGKAAGSEPPAWSEAVALERARELGVDIALFGRLARNGSLVIEPRLLLAREGAGTVRSLDRLTTTPDDLLATLARLPAAYAVGLGIPRAQVDAARLEEAARPTRSVRALELYARGHLALRETTEGQLRGADLLARAIEVDPRFAAAYHALGTVHMALGNRWKATTQFRAAIHVDPTRPEPYKALGDLWMTGPRRLLDQAAEAYAKAIELRPFYAEAHVGLGDARGASGDVDGAVQAYEKALSFDPASPQTHLSLARLYHVEKGLYYEAVDAYKRAATLDPRLIRARLGLGEIYEEKGLYQEAIAEFREALAIEPRHPWALYSLAVALEKVDPREAIGQWERYIAVAGELPSEKEWVDLARQRLRRLQGQIDK